MRITFSIYFILYLSLQNSAFGQNFDVQSCYEPQETGPCKAAIPMYSYHNETDSCVQFSYGGCNGNNNRFSTEEECMKSCQRTHPKSITQNETIDKCLLAPESGMCLAYFERYHFNATTGKCQLFIYGGCGGNENNFKTEEECSANCGSKIELTTIIEKMEEQQLLCSLEAKTGPCKALMPRFYYDNNSSKCRSFIYGGCDGNENNFVTAEDCEQKCVSNKNNSIYENDKSICELNADSGPCEAIFERFYFDIKVGKCEKFTYGGCQGNANNFKTINECQQMCANHTISPIDVNTKNAEVCEQKSESGSCKANFPRFYYDIKTGKCEQFIYGGCNGNTNNFETIESCQEFCMN